MPNLLVNHWYAHPVGHAVEALRYALGYRLADPDLSISVLLNGAAPAELGGCCPFLERTYAVGFTDFVHGEGDAAAALREVPREWDYVVDDHRSREPEQLAAFVGLRRFYEAAAAHFRPRISHGVAGASPPPYVPHGQLRLELPQRARARARAELDGSEPVIALMPAGSSPPPTYPSASSWELIAQALAEALPGLRFCLVGKLRNDGRTTSAITRDEIDRISAACEAVDAFDRPLLDQLALVERCALFLSPHTGFGTAALSVETPWLCLSGGRWHEWFFNGVPFYSVLPHDGYAWMSRLPVVEDDGDGPRIPSMTRGRIDADLPELVAAAEELIAGRVSYEEALRRHFPRLLEAYGGDRSRIFTLDSIHDRYL